MSLDSIQEAYEEAKKYYKKQIKKDAQEINSKWFRSTGKEANNRLNNLIAAKQDSQTRVDQLLQAANKIKMGSSAMTKRFKEQKEYGRLLTEYTKSYIFVQKVRKDITKENLSYLLNLHWEEDSGGKKKTNSAIYKFSLKELIPAFEVVVNDNKTFALAIKNVKYLSQIKNQKATIKNSIMTKINSLYEKIYRQKMDNRQQGDAWIYGPGGIAFESAVRKLADGLAAGEEMAQIDASWRDFEKDIQAFYKAGDLSKEQVNALFKIENTVMELKRVSLKENSVGAGIFGERTVEIVLEKIKNICNTGLSSESQKELEKLFSADEDSERRQMLSKSEKEMLDKIDKIVGAK